MTEERLRDIIFQTLVEEVARRTLEKLAQLQKRALVVCTGSGLAFSRWLVGLQQLEQAGFTFDLYVSHSGAQVIDVAALRRAVPFGRVWQGEIDGPPAALAAPYGTILAPAVTVNTAAKVAACMADTPASQILFDGIRRQKNVVLAVDGCCPDNPESRSHGYVYPDAMAACLRANLERLRSFGVVLTTADSLASKTLEVLAAPRSQGQSGGPARKDGAQHTAAGPAAKKTVIGRQAVMAVPAGGVLRIARGRQITQLAVDAARERGITLLREGR